MKIKYWKNFSKRRNSTKQPAATSATEIDVDLLEPCSTETPDFILNIVDTSINYVQAFGHYYYVTDRIILDGPRMQISCAIDELASAKSDIAAGSAFIERSSILYSNQLIDPLVSTDGVTDCQIISPSETTPFAQSNAGYYIIGVINNEPWASPGMCMYYVLSDLTDLKRYFSSPGSNVQQWAEKTFGHTFDTIISCKYIPIKASKITTTSKNINLGNDDIGIPAGAVTSYMADHTDTFTVPASVVATFRKLDPYTSFKLFIPNYGIVIVPGSCVNDTIKVKYKLDLITGEIFAKVITVNGNTDNLVASIQYNIGIDIPITQLRTVTPNTINGIVGGAAALTGAMTGNPLLVGGAVASGSMGIISGIADQAISVKGGMGGRSMIDDNQSYLYINIVGSTDMQNDALRVYYGKPYMEVNNLSQASGGYVKTRKASISTHLTPNETEAVNAALDSGIYLE